MTTNTLTDRILSTLYADDRPHTITTLNQRFEKRVNAATLYGPVYELEKQGFVEIARDKRDKRDLNYQAMVIEITQKGKEFVTSNAKNVVQTPSAVYNGVNTPTTKETPTMRIPYGACEFIMLSLYKDGDVASEEGFATTILRDRIPQVRTNAGMNGALDELEKMKLVDCLRTVKRTSMICLTEIGREFVRANEKFLAEKWDAAVKREAKKPGATSAQKRNITAAITTPLAPSIERVRVLPAAPAPAAAPETFYVFAVPQDVPTYSTLEAAVAAAGRGGAIFKLVGTVVTTPTFVPAG